MVWTKSFQSFHSRVNRVLGLEKCDRNERTLENCKKITFELSENGVRTLQRVRNTLKPIFL